MYVAACAVRPEQVQHAEWTSSQSSEVPLIIQMEKGSTGQRYIPTTSTQFKRLKGSAQCMTSAQWIDEYKAAEDMKRREIAVRSQYHLPPVSAHANAIYWNTFNNFYFVTLFLIVLSILADVLNASSA